MEIFKRIGIPILTVIFFVIAIIIGRMIINNHFQQNRITSNKSIANTIYIESKAFQGEKYTLPEEVSVKLEDKEIRLPVKWDNIVVDTSKLATLKFDGITEKYNIPVKFILKIDAKVVSIADIKESITKNGEYKLPAKVEGILGDNSKKLLDVKWNVDNVDTAAEGEKRLEGTVDNYDRKVNLTITIQEGDTSNRKFIGYIKKVYDKNGRKYLDVDEVQFFTGEQAINEAKKDGTAEYENGQYYVLNDYYMRNIKTEIKTYEISGRSNFKLVNTDRGINYIKVSYLNFKKLFSKPEVENNGLLGWVNLQDDLVINVEEQYRP